MSRNKEGVFDWRNCTQLCLAERYKAVVRNTISRPNTVLLHMFIESKQFEERYIAFAYIRNVIPKYILSDIKLFLNKLKFCWRKIINLCFSCTVCCQHLYHFDIVKLYSTGALTWTSLPIILFAILFHCDNTDATVMYDYAKKIVDIFERNHENWKHFTSCKFRGNSDF
jgi:hypothetical protein